MGKLTGCGEGRKCTITLVNGVDVNVKLHKFAVDGIATDKDGNNYMNYTPSQEGDLPMLYPVGWYPYHNAKDWYDNELLDIKNRMESDGFISGKGSSLHSIRLSLSKFLSVNCRIERGKRGEDSKLMLS